MSRFFGGEQDGDWTNRGEMVFGYTHLGNLHSVEYKPLDLAHDSALMEQEFKGACEQN
jgi:hypothetical protein